MKKQITVIGILTAVLVIAFMIMSCGSPSQNTSPVANSENRSSIKTPCTESTIRTEVGKIVKGSDIENQNTGTGHPNHKKYFQWDVFDDHGSYVLVFAGGIVDGDKDNDGGNAERVEKFIRDIDQVVKKDCAFKAIFVSPSRFADIKTGKVKLEDVDGFEWGGVCEWPNVPCPGGVCAPECNRGNTNTVNAIDPTNGNGNADTNRNTNANVNANANSNTRRP